MMRYINARHLLTYLIASTRNTAHNHLCLLLRPSQPHTAYKTQDAQLSRRGRVMFRITEYFAASLKVIRITPFNRSHTSSPCRCIITTALSCIIFETKRDTGRISRSFHPTAFDAPVYIAIEFGIEKPEWCSYRWQKTFQNTLSRFNTIPACDRRSDGHLAIFKRLTLR